MKLERIPWQGEEEPAEGELRRRLEADGFAVWAWRDAPETDYRPHVHEEDESIWLVEGHIVFGVDGGEITLGPGDRLMLPKATVHTARVGREGARYLVGQRKG